MTRPLRANLHARCKAQPRRAFTLVEMVTSLAITGIVLTTAGLAVVVTARAVPGADGAAVDRTLLAAALRDRIHRELSCATAVSEWTATAVTFAVPDRDNDGHAEVVRYAWSGKSGEPVTLQYNGSIPTPILEDVREFALVYDGVRERVPGGYAEGPEVLLHSQTSDTSLSVFAVDSNNWAAQVVRPSLPSDAEFWRVTRVRVRVRAHGGNGGETRVQIRGASALSHTPDNVIHDQAALAESLLQDDKTAADSVVYRDVLFTAPQGLARDQSVSVVFQWVRDAHSCDLIYQTGLLSGGGMSRTGNGGGSWSLSSFDLVPMQVYGCVSTQQPDSYRYRATGVRLTVRCGTKGQTVYGETALLNRPEVTVP